MRIAIFDYKVTTNNPGGSCHLRMVRDLCERHEFTVFATEFENPNPARVKFVRVPVTTRPLVLLFVLFHVVAPIVFLAWVSGTRSRFPTGSTWKPFAAVPESQFQTRFAKYLGRKSRL